MRNIKIFFLLNKNADLSTSQLWSSFVKINVCRWYPALIIMRWVLQAVVSGISLAIAGRYIDKGFLVFWLRRLLHSRPYRHYLTISMFT